MLNYFRNFLAVFYLKFILDKKIKFLLQCREGVDVRWDWSWSVPPVGGLSAGPNLKFSSPSSAAWGSAHLHCGSDFPIDKLTSLLVMVCKLLYRIVQTLPKMFSGNCLCMYIASSIPCIEGFILLSATRNSFHSIPLVILRWTVIHFVVSSANLILFWICQSFCQWLALADGGDRL